jgi:hypothetical protein
MIWRTVVGGLSGLLGSLVWAVSLAIYQPLMQPTGFWTDSVSGVRSPILAANNTYWPRETRQLGILLAFGAAAPAGGASSRVPSPRRPGWGPISGSTGWMSAVAGWPPG